MSELGEWDSFYMIVGSAAGALIGLQFVVLTLIAERPPPLAADASAAFATPTIVHFSVVLFFSAAIRAPWHALAAVAGLWSVVALAGLVYTAIVARRLRVQTAYRPGLEDWLFHAVLPWVTYATLGASALAAGSHSRRALFGAGAAMLLLLFVGVHNAWDAVVYHVLVNQRAKRGEDRRGDR